MKSFGLIIESPKPTDYVLGGAASLGGAILQPDGQWDGHLPETEVQNVNGLETYMCVTMTTNNCHEILEKRLYGARDNWSDRYLAKQSGTDLKQGNTPNAVAETRRKKGCVKEYEWPFDVNTWAAFYTSIPKNIETMAIGEGAEYDFGYEFVRSNAKDIMEALKYSPVGFSTYAWVKGEDGKYYRPAGYNDNHFVTVYGYVEGSHWKVFDSYLADGMILKEIRWDTLPMVAMRYTLTKNVVVQSWFDKFIAQLKALLYGLAS